MKTSLIDADVQNNMPRIFFLAISAALGGFLFGFDSGVINGAVGALQIAFNSNAVGTGFNVASMLLGCAAGAFFAGTLADKMGRKWVLILAAVAFIVSAWGSGIAKGSVEFVLYRVLGGLAVGAASILSPAYIGEIAPPKIRGGLISLQQLAIVLGLFAAFFSNYYLVSVSGGASEALWWGFSTWQWMFWMELFPAGAFLLCMLAIPESPRYLVAVGKTEQALKVLAGLSSMEMAKQQVEEIQKTVRSEHHPKLSDVLHEKTRKIHPVVWAGVAIAALQQFTGINVVFYYGAVLWKAAGFTESDALLTNVINGSVNVVFTFVAIYLVDKWGRKPLLLVGALGQAVMLGLLGLVFALASKQGGEGLTMEGSAGLLALIAANGYIAFFACTWGPIVWVMLGEMFSNKFRGAALAIAGLSNWVANFIITMTFPGFLKQFGLGVSYGIYAVFGVVAFLFVQKFVKETKGRTLEQISMDQD